MPSIYDYVTADNIVAYWNTMVNSETEGLLGEELFPSRQKLGLKLEWIKGSLGLPVVIRPSAYDVAALKIDRIGFDKVETTMPFFKDSSDIDEELRQQLNMVLESGNQAYIDSILDMIMDDETRLLRGARAQRERMRMSLLMTGGISISANGQNYDYDYGLKPYQKVTAKVPWSDPTADIVEDLISWRDSVYSVTGIKPTRAVVHPDTLSYFRHNNLIKNGYWGNDSVAPISSDKALDYIQSETKIQIKDYGKKYMDEHKKVCDYVPKDTLAMLPSGTLGTGWFGTTPEQSDLLSGTAANVRITDVGVAVCTSKKIDPVNVDIKVSMIYLPSFEGIDNILIADLATA